MTTTNTNTNEAEFLLFVANGSAKSRRARQNVQRVLRNYDVQVVDITREARTAKEYGILAVPALLIAGDAPTLVLGTLDNLSEVAAALGLSQKDNGDG